MYHRTWILSCCLLLLSCAKDAPQVASLPQDKFIQAYFNQRENQPQTYIDPYRQIERSGDNLAAIIVEEILTAKLSIDLAVQELNLPLIAAALVQKHNSGVKVRIILDNNYSRSITDLSKAEIESLNQRDRQKYNQLFELIDLDRNRRLSSPEIAQRDALTMLRKAGVEIIDDTADGSKGSGLMHHKFMVVDRQTVILGSANFTLSGLLGDLGNPASRGNVNHLLRLDNAQIARLFSEEFEYMWGDTESGIESKFGLAKPWRSPQTITWGNTAITLQFAPTSQQQDWSFSTNGLIGKTLEEATESINLALFVFSEQQLADILQEKSQSGVEINGIFDAGFAYRYYSEMLDLLGITLYFRCQPEAGNNPWIDPLRTVGTNQANSGDKLHHKFTVIDSKTVISGSQNWSQAGNQNNDEAVIIIQNKTVAAQFSSEFDRLYQRASFDLPTKVQSKIKQQQLQCDEFNMSVLELN
ncbi:MAG: phospholipase D-like domain-containing protein [Cyanobacteria bacterium J06629_2]